MRYVYVFITGLFCLVTGGAWTQNHLHVFTFNIRYDNPADSPNHWLARKEKVASQILFHDADVVGVQEALHHQVEDLKKLLPGFAFTGVGRDDGKTKGEYAGIFYRSSRLQLLASSTFWLSLTPTVPGSKSWDAAITRIVTWARFKDKATGKIYYHFNTHFDHMGQDARRQSAHLLLQKVKEIAGATPALITGDFNAKPADEPIQVITNINDPLRLFDSKQASKSGHYGPTGTFNAFGPKEVDSEPIDYIFTKGKWQVLKHATLSQAWNGRYASDHFAVMAQLMLQ